MRPLLLVMLAGGIGCGLRFVTSTALTRATGAIFPWGTLTVNLVGCLLIGLFGYLGLEAKVLSRDAIVAITSGFLGGLTTFSSFGYESLKMFERRELTLTVAYAIGSILLGLIAVWLGGRLGRALG